MLSPVTLPWLSRSPLIGLAYATEAPPGCPNSGGFASTPIEMPSFIVASSGLTRSGWVKARMAIQGNPSKIGKSFTAC
jgi:hypothetical protein